MEGFKRLDYIIKRLNKLYNVPWGCLTKKQEEEIKRLEAEEEYLENTL